MPNEARDPRTTIYQDLHHHQLRRQEDANRHSAALILTELFRRYAPRSVLDVGCGLVIGIQFKSTLGIQSKSTDSTTLACGADAAAGGRGCALWTILPGFDKPTETG